MAVPYLSRPRHIWRLLPVAALSACTAVGPDFKAPAPSWSPVSWLTGHTPPKPVPHQPAPSTPTEAKIDPSWWSLFHDDELTKLENQVVGANLDVRIAAQRLRESRAALGVAEAAGLPTVEGNAAYSRQQLSKNGVLSLAGSGAATTPQSNTAGAGVVRNSGSTGIFSPFNLYQAGFDATWEVDFWGHAKRGVESAEATATAAGEAERDVLVRTLAELARDYVQMRGVQVNIEITRRNLKSAENSLSLTQQRAAGGLTTDLDVANAAALVASISAEIPTQEAQRDDLIDAIALLLGKPPQALGTELATARPIPPAPPIVPVGLPSELARRRPDIRQAEATLHEATANVGVAVADFYPRVVLSGSVAVQAVQFKDMGNWGQSNTWAFGPTLILPIFEGGRLHRTLELREAQQQEAAITYQRTVLSALHEVDTALTDYAAQQRRRDALRVAVEQNRHALDLAQDRYTNGVSDFLNVLDAQRNLLAAEQQYTDASTQIAVNLVALYKSLGGGWQTDLPDTPAPEQQWALRNILE